MLNMSSTHHGGQRGVTLIEVLVSIVIMAIGLLGLAGLQSKLSLAEAESYQRAQALLLLSDMTERMNANRVNASSYVFSGTTGTDNNPVATCVGSGAARDLCEWRNLLKGAGEKKSSSNVGAMIGARGCITEIQAPNTAGGICAPGIYLVTVVWQGLHPTVAPASTCGQDLFGDDKYRRAISSRVVIGLPACT